MKDFNLLFPPSIKTLGDKLQREYRRVPTGTAVFPAVGARGLSPLHNRSRTSSPTRLVLAQKAPVQKSKKMNSRFRGNDRVRWFSLFLLALLISTTTAAFGQTQDFTLPSVTGQTHTLSQYQGKNPVLLVFFATWCPPCNREVPHLVDLQKTYGGRGLKILAVDVAESEDAVRQFVREKEINYTVLLDPKGETADQYHVNGIPTNILIDKNGEVKFEGHSIPKNIEDVL